MKFSAATLGLAAALAAAPAFATDPPVPVGQDPGGDAVATIDTAGIDYTMPAIAGVLARDGEGEIIGWDFVDNDNRPYSKVANDRAAAIAADSARNGKRLIPVRVDAAHPATLASAIAFVAKTPAKSATFAVGPLKRTDWEPFRQAMLKFKDLKVYLGCRDQSLSGEVATADPDALIFADQLGLPNVYSCPDIFRPALSPR